VRVIRIIIVRDTTGQSPRRKVKEDGLADREEGAQLREDFAEDGGVWEKEEKRKSRSSRAEKTEKSLSQQRSIGGDRVAGKRLGR